MAVVGWLRYATDMTSAALPSRRRALVSLVVLALAETVFAALVSSQATLANALRGTLVGTYDGGQIEMAVGLELHADGRFAYGMSYGALDEEAEGKWSVNGGHVELTSDPVTPPRFLVLGQHTAAAGQLRIRLDLPHGLSRQYFEAEVQYADGSQADFQLSDREEPLDVGGAKRPVSVALVLPIFDLRSDPVKLGQGGIQVDFRFEPHDLGKVKFSRTPLRIDQGDLILIRYGRTIRFRRVAKAQ